VEFRKLERAVENLFRIERQIGDGAALHLHASVDNRARAVVIAAGDGDGHLDHWASWWSAEGIGGLDGGARGTAPTAKVLASSRPVKPLRHERRSGHQRDQRAPLEDHWRPSLESNQDEG